MSLLDERELSDVERIAIADEPRPGVWIEGREADLRGSIPAHRRGDGRTLTQEQTDELIYRELYDRSGVDEMDTITHLHGPWNLPSASFDNRIAYEQRGGLHSDPLVRLLAYRAWGERDREWNKRDTAKAVGVGCGDDFERGASSTDSTAWPCTTNL